MNLQGLLVQSSKWFGISSVQVSSLVTSLSGKFVRFINGAPILECLVSSVSSSVSSVQFDIHFNETPDGAPFGVLLGIPRRVAIKLSRKVPNE